MPIQAITNRFQQGQEASALLANGRDAAKTMLLAKKCAQDAEALERNLQEMLAGGSAMYEEAALTLPEAMKLEAIGIQWSESESSLGATCHARAEAIKQALKMIPEPVELPAQTPMESDATLMLTAKAGVLKLPGAQAAADRINVGKAGKKLVEDGGENAVLALIAKQVSKDAVLRDAKIREAVSALQGMFDESATSIRAARAEDKKAEGIDWPAETTDGLVQAYDARLQSLKEVEALLNDPLPVLELTPTEEDALKVQNIKTRCAAARVQVAAVVEPYSQAAQGRLNQAKAGKELLDRGGENAVMAVVAKKIAKDATANDKDLATKQIASAVLVFEDAAAALKALPTAEGISPVTNVDELVKAYEAKVEVFKEVQKLLADPSEVMQLTPVERDAVRVVQLSNAYVQARVQLEGSSLLKGILLQGGLKKRGPTVDFAWEDRYCTLSRRKLSYFTEATCSELKGDIDILPETRVYAMKHSSAPGDAAKHSTERPFGFVLDPEPSAGKDRKLYYFDAESADKQQMWTKTIEEILTVPPSAGT